MVDEPSLKIGVGFAIKNALLLVVVVVLGLEIASMMMVVDEEGCAFPILEAD